MLRLASRTVYLALVVLATLSLLGLGNPCVPSQAPHMISILIPDHVAGRWYACREVLEADLNVPIALRVMPTTVEWATPPNYPVDVMREVLEELIRTDDLPDMAMLPRDLARDISDRCLVFDLDAYACYIGWPFLYEGIDGVILPWASDLSMVFFEPGSQVELGLALLSHPAIASLSPPADCCSWPPEPEPMDCRCSPCGACSP